MFPAALLLLLLSRTALAASPPPYDSKLAPLDPLSWELLKDNGYELREDWKVWDKIGEKAVARDEMPFLLSKLGSARRLKALLELNMIFNRYEGRRAKLSAEDSESVREIVRRHWAVFGIRPRREFRSYFSKEELFELDKIPPRMDSASPLSMRDPEPGGAGDEPAEPAAPVPSAEQAAAAVPASVTAAPPETPPTVAPPQAYAFRPVATLTPLLEPLSLRRPSPFVKNVPTQPAAPAVAVAPVALPAALPPAAAPPPTTPPPAPATAQQIAPAQAAIAPKISPPGEAPKPSPDAPPGFLRPITDSLSARAAQPPVTNFAPTAPPPAATAPAAPSAVSPAVAAALAASRAQRLAGVSPNTQGAVPTAPAAAIALPVPAPDAPRPKAVTAEEFEAFVQAGPYGREGKALLLLAAKKAPEFSLPLLRRTVVSAVPQLVIDGARTGAGLRAGRESSGTGVLVALSPGPVFVERKKSFFGSRQALLLPESPSAWSELGVPVPGLQALRRDSVPAASQESDWGTTKVYSDGSRRGAYFPQQQAGELLEQLLLLGLEREGLAGSAYAARRWARTARLLLSLKLKEELGQDAFLDPDRRAELRDWIERSEESDDLSVAVWSSARASILDPRRGPPDAERDYEARARSSCVRSELEDSLAEAGRRRAARVATLEGLLEADLLDESAARAAAQAASDEEAESRRKLLLAPPACPRADAAREAGLRKSSLLLAESTRAERALREQRGREERRAN